MEQAHYSIGDLEKLTGIKTHTIRMWEKRYGILIPERTDTHIRYYDDKDLQYLLNISLLKQHGFKISQIADMTLEEIKEEVDHIASMPSGDMASVHRLVEASLEFNEDLFEKVLNESILKLGFEESFFHVVFPFLEKAGLMTQIGKFPACNDRFVNNLLRKKLSVTIDGLTGQNQSLAKKFLLFLPKDENFDLPLLFMNYLVRKSGYCVVYLGTDISVDQLKKLPNKEGFSGLMISSNMFRKDQNISAYIDELSDIFPGKLIYLYTCLPPLKEIRLPDHVRIFYRLEEFRIAFTKNM
ncbi:MAG: MerR family transcriptional regulator [Clostridiales bacterium]|nr:MerR family transcriptional regulator [Clostridiales bacterium]